MQLFCGFKHTTACIKMQTCPIQEEATPFQKNINLNVSKGNFSQTLFNDTVSKQTDISNTTNPAENTESSSQRVFCLETATDSFRKT